MTRRLTQLEFEEKNKLVGAASNDVYHGGHKNMTIFVKIVE